MHDVLKQIEARSGNQKIKTAINPGEGAFYGPKFEYVLRDAIGRDWQCGTTQVDFNLPERFEAFYIAADGSKTDAGDDPPRHLRLDGTIPRRGARTLCRPPAALACAETGGDLHHRLGCRRLCARDRRGPRTASAFGSRLDLRNEKINYKVREHSLAKVPVLLVVGKKEAAERTVSIRRLGSDGQKVMPLDEALKMLADEALPPDLKRALTAQAA